MTDNIKAAVITGALGSAGRAIAARLSEEGYRIAALDLPSLDGDTFDVGDGSVFLPADLTDSAQVEAAFAKAMDQLGGLDVLINCAGINGGTQIEQLQDGELDAFLSANVNTTVLCCRAAVPYMKRAGKGSILNIGDTRSRMAMGSSPAYAASKGAISAFTRELAADVWRYNIRCNALSPSAFTEPDSAIDPTWADDQQRMVLSDRLMTPADVAEVASFLISDDAFTLNGTELFLDGGGMFFRDRPDKSGMQELPGIPPAKDGKPVAVFNGGAGGIGSACAMEMAKRGYRIAIIDFNEERGLEVKAELNSISEAELFLCDITDVCAIEQTAAAIFAHFGRIDGLANLAAITDHLRAHEITPERWDHFMAIDIKAQFFMAKECAKYMSKSGGGRIVNFSSSMAYMADGRHVLYGTAKSAINGMMRNLAVDLWRDNIQVNSLLPCYIITPLVVKHLDEPGWLDMQLERVLATRMVYPEDMAKMCAFLLTCKTPFLNGQEILAGAGYLDFIRKIPKDA